MLSTLFKIPYLRLKYRFFPNQAQKFWAQELLEAQGLSAKLGQVLAQGHESELPKSSLSPEQAQTIFHQNFGQNIEISQEVLAASMGQVFFIKIENKEFALKILHPKIKEKLKREIKNILILGSHFAKVKGFHFDQETFKRFLENVFAEETDLKREAHFQAHFFKIFSNDLRFKVPEVISHFSNDQVLCQEKVSSILARDLKDFPHFHIFDFFFSSLLHHGLLHGDLNDRNWGLDHDQTVVVYDYGCSQIISERRINGLKKLFLNQDVINGFKEFGVRLEASWFKGKEQELRDALFIPLLEEQILPEWSYSQSLNNQFGEKIKQLREYTDPWVLLMMRSLFSLIRIYQSRNKPVPLGSIVKPYLSLKGQNTMQAQNIKIQVMEDKHEVIFMTLPITALENLDNLMPEKVTSKISAEGIDVKKLIEKVKESNYAPQELFSLQIEKRSYKVWID